MPALFWIVHEINNKPSVFIQEGPDRIHARMKASIAGFTGTFKEIHMLDDKIARRVPKAMIGRALSEKEVKGLLKRMEGK